MSEENKEQLSFELNSKPAPEENGKNQTEPVEDSMEWICHPAKRNMKITALVTIFLIVIVGVVYFVTYSVLFSVLAIVFLFGSLAPFYFPTNYTLTENEIIVKTKMQRLVKKWSQYRTYYPDKNGVLLSPFVRKTRMENFRGLYVKFEGNKDEVMTFVTKRMEAQKLDTNGEN